MRNHSRVVCERPAWRLAVAALLLSGTSGCMSRVIGEGAGVVLGARGRVVDIDRPSSLSRYRSVRVESISISPGLPAPASIAGLVRNEFQRRVRDHFDLEASGSPALILTGQVIHYESDGMVDEVIGPLEEVIVRTQLRDAATGSMVGEANLIGRAKSTTSSGAANLAEGAGRALQRWLDRGGLPKRGRDRD